MATFKMSEANVKKNFFRIFVKTQENIALYPAANLPADLKGLACGTDDTEASAGQPLGSTGFFNTLYTNYYEQVGSCKSEPKIGSSDVEGIKNNIGSSLGASKEVSVEYALIDLDGGTEISGNYLSAIGLEGKPANYVFFDEKSGVVHYVTGVVSSVNLASVGNGFEELPVIAKREAAKITDVANRYKLNPGAVALVEKGKVVTASIVDGGVGFVAAVAATQSAVLPVGRTGAGFTCTVPAVNAGAATSIAITGNGGTNYQVGDLLVMESTASTKAMILRVTSIATA